MGMFDANRKNPFLVERERAFLSKFEIEPHADSIPYIHHMIFLCISQRAILTHKHVTFLPALRRRRLSNNAAPSKRNTRGVSWSLDGAAMVENSYEL